MTEGQRQVRSVLSPNCGHQHQHPAAHLSDGCLRLDIPVVCAVLVVLQHLLLAVAPGAVAGVHVQAQPLDDRQPPRL